MQMRFILIFVSCNALFMDLNPAFSSVPTFETNYETTPVPAGIDNTDDPAIWLHPTSAEKSLVIGVSKNKKVTGGQVLVFII